MPDMPISQEDLEWRAGSDARTMMDHEVIIKDKDRLARAKVKINEMKLEKMAELKALKKLSKE